MLYYPMTSSIKIGLWSYSSRINSKVSNSRNYLFIWFLCTPVNFKDWFHTAEFCWSSILTFKKGSKWRTFPVNLSLFCFEFNQKPTLKETELPIMFLTSNFYNSKKPFSFLWFYDFMMLMVITIRYSVFSKLKRYFS